jgi:hypothetical protein
MTRPKFFWMVCASLIFSAITCPWFLFTLLVRAHLTRELFGRSEMMQLGAMAALVAFASIISTLIALYWRMFRREIRCGHLIAINVGVNLLSILWCAFAWEMLQFWNGLHLG